MDRRRFMAAGVLTLAAALSLRLLRAQAAALYAMVMGRPKSGRVSIRSLGRGAGLAQGEVRSVRLLGHDGELTWSQDDKALSVELPPGSDEMALALRIEGLE